MRKAPFFSLGDIAPDFRFKLDMRRPRGCAPKPADDENSARARLAPRSGEALIRAGFDTFMTPRACVHKPVSHSGCADTSCNAQHVDPQVRLLDMIANEGKLP